MSAHETEADLEAARQIDQSDHESQAFERSDAAKVAAVAALVDDSQRNHMEDEAGAHVVYVWELRTALADPDAALAAIRAEARAEALRDAADVDLSGALASNELCVAADRRGYAYATGNASDEQLAMADADFVTTVEHFVGTYAKTVSANA